MTISGTSETFNINPGQTTTFTPASKPTSDVAGATVVTASSANVSPNPPWAGFLVNGSTCEFQVTSPSDCTPTTATITINLQAFDNMGQVVDTDTIDHTITCGVVGITCNAPSDQSISEGTAFQLSPTNFSNDATSFVSFTTVPDLSAHITTIGADRRIGTTAPPGSYVITGVVQNDAGESCSDSFTLTITEVVISLDCTASTLPTNLSHTCGSGAQGISVGPIIDSNGDPVTNATFTASSGTVNSSVHNGNGNYVVTWTPPATCTGGGTTTITVCG